MKMSLSAGLVVAALFGSSLAQAGESSVDASARVTGSSQLKALAAGAAREWGFLLQLPDSSDSGYPAVWKMRFFYGRTRPDGVTLYRGTADSLEGTRGFGASEAFAQRSPDGGAVYVQIRDLNLQLRFCASASAPTGLELCEAEEVSWRRGKGSFPLGDGPGRGSLILDANTEVPARRLTPGFDLQLFGLTPVSRTERFKNVPIGEEPVKVRGKLEFSACDGCEHTDQIFLEMMTDQVALAGRYVRERVNVAPLTREWGAEFERDCPGRFSDRLQALLQTGVRLTYTGRLTSESEDLWHGGFWTAVEAEDARLTLDVAGKVRVLDYLQGLPEGGTYSREMGSGLEGGWSEILVYRAEGFESRLNLETGELVQKDH
jgi:hypothetical protein